MAEIKAELSKPYGKDADEATGFQLTTGTINETRITMHVNMSEAVQLMAQIAAGIREYRTALTAKFGASIDTVVAEVEHAFSTD